MKILNAFLAKKTGPVSGIGPRIVLPALIGIALGATGVRINSVFETMEKGALFSPTAEVQAASGAPKAADEAPKAAKPVTPQAHAAEHAAPAEDEDEDEPKPAATGAERDIMNQLSSRRQELDDRAKALDARESLIRVAEQRVDQKVKEMETLRAQVQALVNQATGAQNAQIENLVKIYETMKPKEAAKILETLDMPILLGVVQKMKPQRVAVVMAEMAPEKAKEITVALTKQDQLPQIK